MSIEANNLCATSQSLRKASRDGGTSAVPVKRKRSEAATEDEEREQAARDVEAATRRGSMLLQRVFDHDRYAAFIASRDTNARREFVAEIRDHLARKFHLALTNPESSSFRDQFHRFFDVVSGQSPTANMLQMFLIHVAVVLEERICERLCPPPPDPDDADARDTSLVDRYAFTKFYKHYLLPAYRDLRDGTTMTPTSFTREMNTIYMALLPTDPLRDALRTRNARHITFTDADAREALRSIERAD